MQISLIGGLLFFDLIANVALCRRELVLFFIFESEAKHLEHVIFIFLLFNLGRLGLLTFNRRGRLVFFEGRVHLSKLL